LRPELRPVTPDGSHNNQRSDKFFLVSAVAYR
jgi:hypothetical protein